MNDPRLLRQIQSHPYRLLFVTISGAHLYGFPSPDSDFDLRGVHLLPLENLLSLRPSDETVERSGIHDGLEIDLVTHDARKFFALMLRRNGYVLEQLTSPLIVQTCAAHQELVSLVPQCVTRFHAFHYLGFAETQWKLFSKETPPRVKPLLYVYRVLLTGIHLMKTGRIEANLVTLNEEARLPQIADLVAIKLSSPEKGKVPHKDLSFHAAEYQRLRTILHEAFERSSLPDSPTAEPALEDLLLRLRFHGVS